MVLLDEGLEELGTQFATLITQGQWGTGTALPIPTDTGLGAAVATTLAGLTITTSGNSVQFTHNLVAATANPSALTEFELRYSGGDSLNRTLGGTINKTSSFEVVTITTVNFIRN